MLEGNILNNPVNVLVHDCWAPYWNPALDVGEHAVCNAHIIRELENVVKLAPGAHWALLMTDMLLRANNACKNARDRGCFATIRNPQKRHEEFPTSVRKGYAWRGGHTLW